uniref:Secreted peptide n=1 Tax=Poecilia reticulata TaxID=8081 RepID=A0A3P9Q8A5_POERE
MCADIFIHLLLTLTIALYVFPTQCRSNCRSHTFLAIYLFCSIFIYLFRIFNRGGTFRRHGWHTISATRPLVRPPPAGKAEEEHD